MAGWCNDSEHIGLRRDLSDTRLESEKRQHKVDRAALLVAGAMRQGYVSQVQRECLLYAFMALTGEPSEKIAAMLAFVKPKDY